MYVGYIGVVRDISTPIEVDGGVKSTCRWLEDEVSYALAFFSIFPYSVCVLNIYIWGALQYNNLLALLFFIRGWWRYLS